MTKKTGRERPLSGFTLTFLEEHHDEVVAATHSRSGISDLSKKLGFKGPGTLYRYMKMKGIEPYTGSGKSKRAKARTSMSRLQEDVAQLKVEVAQLKELLDVKSLTTQS